MKHNLFLGYKKAQMGETITWIVATLIIIVLILISIFIVRTGIGFSTISLPDREVSFVSSKSIYSFTTFNWQAIVNAVNTDQIGSFNPKLDFLMKTLSSDALISIFEDWDYNLYTGADIAIRTPTYLRITIRSGKIKLDFWRS